MYDLWPDIDPVSDSSTDGSIDEGIKYQEKINDQDQEELVSVTRRNLMGIIQGYQIALIQLKSDTEKSKYKIFFIKHIAAGSAQAKCMTS